MSIQHVDDVMRVMQHPHDDGAQRLCFRFLQQPCVEVMIGLADGDPGAEIPYSTSVPMMRSMGSSLAATTTGPRSAGQRLRSRSREKMNRVNTAAIATNAA